MDEADDVEITDDFPEETVGAPIPIPPCTCNFTDPSKSLCDDICDGSCGCECCKYERTDFPNVFFVCHSCGRMMTRSMPRHKKDCTHANQNQTAEP